MRKLELPQRRSTKWILPTIVYYKDCLVFLEVLAIAFYHQMLESLTLTIICNGAHDLCWEDFISLKEGPRREKRKFQVAENHDLSHPTTNFLLALVNYDRFFHLLTLQDLLVWNHCYFQYSDTTLPKISAKTTLVRGEWLADAETTLAYESLINMLLIIQIIINFFNYFYYYEYYYYYYY